MIGLFHLPEAAGGQAIQKTEDGLPASPRRAREKGRICPANKDKIMRDGPLPEYDAAEWQFVKSPPSGFMPILKRLRFERG
ncbi:MAG: hypothetical protein LBU64_01955 [Planctomycetota bacterium]|nr:hypothetical protein [Planctomycetota bacterium]